MAVKTVTISKLANYHEFKIDTFQDENVPAKKAQIK